MGGGRPRWRGWSLLAAALLWGGPARAQSPGWLFPERQLLPDLLAGPRDPVVKGQAVYATDGPTRFGDGAAGDVAIAATLPLLRLDGAPGDAVLVLGLEGAAFARFSFQVVERELVDTDWVFAVPMVWRRGDDWLRLRYLHTSSHLGDEYARRFDERGENVSRDGLDLTGYLTLTAGVATYGGVFWSANSHPEDAAPWVARAGLEVDPSRRTPWHPYLAVDVSAEEDSGWEPRLVVQAGIWLPPPRGRPLRLAVELLTGPSPMGQFHGVDTTQLGIGLFWNP